jgi:hypothetical protein
MDTSYYTLQSKMQEGDARRKKVKEDKAGSRNSSTDSVNSGSGPDYQIYRPLGWVPW